MNIKVLVSYLLSGPLVLVLSTSANCQAIRNSIPDVARPLPLSAVRITGGPLKHAQDLDRAYLLKLEPDRMMAYYRQRAGLEPKAQGYPGWDGGGRNLTGHTIPRSPPGSATGHFYDVNYTIPSDVVKDKKKLTVKFQAANGDESATVFGVRIVRADQQ